MRKFEFTGDWETSIKLPEFGKLNNTDFFSSHIKESVFDIAFEYETLRDNNPDPLKTQINTINFILNNETKILISIYNYFVEVIYPRSKKYIPQNEYPHCYPTLESFDDLINVFSLNNIEILPESKDDYSYCTYYISSCLDFGHGLGIIMHKNRCIDFNEIGMLDRDKIKEDDGLIKNDFFSDVQVIENGLYLNHPKYNNLKPWQLYDNENYPNRLLSAEKIDELEELLDKAEISDKTKSELIRNSVVWGKSTTILKRLLSQIKKTPFQAMEQALQAKDIEKFKLLFQYFDVKQTSTNTGGYTITDAVIRIYLRETNNKENNERLLNYLFDKGAKIEPSTISILCDINERESGNSRKSTLKLIDYFRNKEKDTPNKNWINRLMKK